MKSHTKRMLRACLSLLLALIIAVSPISITASAAQYSTCTEAKETAEDAIFYSPKALQIVDILVIAIQDYTNYLGQTWLKDMSFVRDEAIDTIKSELANHPDEVAEFGFSLANDSDLMANELYELAWSYYAAEQKSGKDYAYKVSAIELLRFYLVEKGGYSNNSSGAQEMAEYYYSIYEYALANGETAAIQAEVAKASSHTYGNWYTVTEATCTADGQKRQDCSGCGAFNTETITSKGHSWGDWFTETEATCTDPGQERRDCDNCDAYETNVIPTAEHEYTKLNYNTTSHWYECTCGDKAEPQDHVDSDGNDECDVCDYTIDPIGSTGVYGDADGDNEITAIDASLILQYCANLIDENHIDLSACDVDGDGNVTAIDASLILQYCADLIDTLTPTATS